MKFEYFTADDGLSDNIVHNIYRDSKDYLWIGTTNNGLNKYDGNKITIYKSVYDQPGSISNNAIRYIFEDSKNNIWIGTKDGLNLYDPKSESFTVFRHNYHDTITNYGNYITCIIEDTKGNLWATNNHGIGLIKWNYKKNSYSRYRIENHIDDYYVNSFTSIREDSKGNFWIVSRGSGIYRFEPESESFTAYLDQSIDLGKKTIKKLCIDQDDNIWIGSNGGGLYSFNPFTGKFKHFGTNIGNKGTNSNLVFDIIQTDDHHLLIATDQGGINCFDMISETFEYILYNEKNDQGLNSNGILCLHQDKEGILWVGTSRGGVNYFNPKQNKFKHFNHNDKNPNSLSYNIVGCFYEDSEGLIWIGTDGGGVNVFNPKTENFTIYKHDPSNPYSISGDVIRCISEDKDGEMWIGTWDAGLNRYDKKTKRFYHYFKDKKNISSISSNTIWYLKIDHNNNIWLGCYEQGVNIFNKKKGVVKRFSTNPNNPKTLCSNDVTFIYEDLQYNIWICTHNGISLYDSINNSFTAYKDFPDNDIGAFCRDKEGKLWVGSINKGLFLFKQDGTIVKTYNNKNGLPDNTIHAIVEDDHGNLWISTNKGISHFNQKTQKFRNYNKSDGLQGNIFFQQSFLKTRKGEIYFGGYDGFNSFHPNSIKDNNYIPKVYITGFKLFNKPVQIGIPGSPLQNPISETKEITLTWRESVFSFEFNAINYTHPEKNEYAYIMDGFEKEWNYVGNKRDATYTNMDAGEYTFRVKASNNDDVWNNEGTSIKIVITPPFWETWWFRGIIIFTGIVILFSIYFIRVSTLRNQKIMLKKEVDLRTKELKLAYDNIKNISEFGQKITSTLDFKGINEMIYDYTKSFIDTFDFGIGIYISDREIIEYKMFYEDGKLMAPFKHPLSDKNSFSVYCVEKQETIFINDLKNEYKTYLNDLPDFSISRFPNSLINIPLTVNEKKIGLLAINSVKKNAFTKNDLLKLQTLAAYIAIALDNAKSHTTLLENNKLLLKRQKKIEEQSNQLNETNTILEERQQQIEEQSEELHAQAEELFVTNENLKNSNATKDKLFSIIAHDLKNPFSSVIGFSEMIIKKWDRIDNNKMKHMIETIYSSAKSVFSLLENLLQWSRSQMGNIKFNPENISLYNLAKENIVLLSNLIAQKNISIMFDIPNDLYCYADSQMITTVIRNILTNAIKFTENGTITISSEIKENMVNISISDTGIGIVKDKLNNLFEVEKSKSTNGTRGEQGTGLGLIICKEFITKNNGQIYATSEKNKGTTFVFTLPINIPINKMSINDR